MKRHETGETRKHYRTESLYLKNEVSDEYEKVRPQ